MNTELTNQFRTKLTKTLTIWRKEYDTKSMATKIIMELIPAGRNGASVRLREMQMAGSEESDKATLWARSIRVQGIVPGEYRIVVRVDGAQDATLLLIEHHEDARQDNRSEVLALLVEEEVQAVSQTKLLGNYPNPFNPTTIIGYQLAEDGPVTLQVYDVLGRLVATLVDGHIAAGSHQVSFNATHLASGMYIYKMQAGHVVQSQTMFLVK